MSTPLLVVVSFLEAALLVGALAFFLLAIARRLRSIAGRLAVLLGRVEELERETGGVQPAVSELNWTLEKLARDVGLVADRAEALERRGEPSP